MSELWCLHILGPDDVHAAPNKAEAERAVGFLAEYYKDDRMDPPISFEAIPWPHSPESHAEDVKFFYVNTGVAPPVQPGESR